MTVPAAKRAAISGLREEFGREYRNRRAFRMTCRRSAPHRAVCRTSWVTKRYRYRGVVIITRGIEDNKVVTFHDNRVRRYRK